MDGTSIKDEQGRTPARTGEARAFEADYQATIAAAGVHVLEGRIIVRVIGDDRVSFFHGMCSADVKGAASGAILPALILTEHAHVIAELFIWVTDDALLLDIDAEGWARARAHLERLLVADDVEFEESDEISVIDVEGPKARDAAVAILGSAESLGEWRFASDGGRSVGIAARLGGPAVSVIAPRIEVESIGSKILATIAGSRRVGAAVLETIRIENGLARIGVDTTDKTIALEARLNRAISFNKGCYLGQETIERATARGGLKKRMFGLKFNRPIVPGARSGVSLAGKEVGRVSSTAISPRFGAIGLAILHHSAWTPGTELTIDDEGGVAIVSNLPFKQK